MKILVTGGAGFFGSAVVKSLEKSEIETVVLDDLSTGSLENLVGFQGHFIKGSILNDQDLLHALAGIDLVIHMAVKNVRESLTNPKLNFEVNALGTLKILENIRNLEIEKFIYFSSSEVYGNSARASLRANDFIMKPSTVYGVGKLSGEMLTRAFSESYGISHLIIRPFNVYGPDASKTTTGSELVTRFVYQRLAGRPFTIYGSGSQVRDLTYVDDAAKWVVELVNKYNSIEFKSINLGSGFTPTVLEVAKIVSEVIQTNTDVSYNFMEVRPGDIESLIPDLTETRKIIQLDVSTSIQEGILLVADKLKSSPELYLEDRNW